MSAQISYSINHDIGYHGQLADLNPTTIITALAEGVIAFGVAVTQGTADDQGVAGGVTRFLGIATRDLALEGVKGTNVVDYGDTEAASLLKEGYIYLTIPTGGAKGDPLKFINATGVIDAGAVLAGETAIVGLTLEQTVGAGAIALCSLL